MTSILVAPAAGQPVGATERSGLVDPTPPHPPIDPTPADPKPPPIEPDPGVPPTPPPMPEPEPA